VGIIVLSTGIGLAYSIGSLFFGASFVDTSARLPIAFQLLLPFQFAGPLLTGMIARTGSLPRPKLLFAVLPIIPSTLLGLIWTGRTTIIVPILCWLAGYVAMESRDTSGRVELFKLSRIAGLLALVLALGLTVIVVDAFRGVRGTSGDLRDQATAYSEVLNTGDVGQKWSRTRAGLFSNVYTFSYYFSTAWYDPPAPTGGTIIFAAPLDLLGFAGQRYPFESFEMEKGIESNVYTMFRPPIDDFGLVGSLVWWVALGFVQGWAYRRIAQGSYVPCVLLAWFYVDVCLVGGMFFRYNSLIVSYLIVALVLWRLTIKHAPVVRVQHIIQMLPAGR
jgi:oligosaccharide repeat unit polymerase